MVARRLYPTGELPLHAPPVDLPANWSDLVHEPQTQTELTALRTSIQRGTPFGSARWKSIVVKKLGLQSTIRPRGRPRAAKK